jgi:transglutaminase-like putative cysteine protease
MLLSIAFAVTRDNRLEIYEIAETLVGDSEVRTALNVDARVEEIIKYNFSWYSQGIDNTWKMKKGDCTDRAELKCYMLDHLNVTCKTVHGWIVKKKGNERVKHDFAMYYIDNEWKTNEMFFWYRINLTGDGIW